jgi:hypothetical protein
MQFILTLLISVRGRKLLKDGFDLSFAEEVGLTDTQASSGGPTWTGSRPLDLGGECVCCECRVDGEGKREKKHRATVSVHQGSLPCVSVYTTPFLKTCTGQAFFFVDPLGHTALYCVLVSSGCCNKIPHTV